MTRDEGISELGNLRKIRADGDARAAALELGARCEDPLIRAGARVEEIRRSRVLGEQQRAIVAS
ncbi:MAG: hypothetical protein R3B09_27875, partial [Nannocystaceae bacterium]